MPSVNKVKPLRLASTNEAQDLLVDVDDVRYVLRLGRIGWLSREDLTLKGDLLDKVRASLHPQPLEISVDGQLFVKTDHTIRRCVGTCQCRAEPRDSAAAWVYGHNSWCWISIGAGPGLQIWKGHRAWETRRPRGVER